MIDRHLGESIPIARLSKAVKMSEALFRRRFKEITGRSVHRYIRTQRVQRAREMIEETNLALSAIAASCGFSSQSHLTAVYRQELGITPGGQRRQWAAGVRGDTRQRRI
ncbi:MAG TPA: helix-turn-helix transcriptional regulator [Gammaproteobacteria bacterium]|nr:helix-turn-helix transcriptional regulator [Gammaproteobacteria bacterium]